MQVFVHEVEQAPEGEFPAQLIGGVHGDVDATYKHELKSTWQVATVWPSWHTVPGCVQIEPGQVHAAVPLETAHAWFGPHVLVVTQAVHPLACSWQVCTAPEMHWVAPAVHGLMHVLAPASAASPEAPLLASEPPLLLSAIASTEASRAESALPSSTESTGQVAV
jgi:hypothetical protein